MPKPFERTVLDEVDDQRHYMEGLWGRDRENALTQKEWKEHVRKRIPIPDFRESMLHIAAVAVAAIEAYDRKR